MSERINWRGYGRQACPACKKPRCKALSVTQQPQGAIAYCHRCEGVWHEEERRPALTMFDFGAARRVAEQSQHQKAERQSDAAMRAAVLWAGASGVATLDGADGYLVGDHPYLARKRCLAHGVRVDLAGRLVVPMYLGGRLINLQAIRPDGEKRYLPGGRTDTATFLLTDCALDDTCVWVAEGFATAATVHEATALPTLVAFAAHNLAAAAAAAKQLYPRSWILIAADHDPAGLKAAEEAAAAVHSGLCYPPTVGHDWNDVRVSNGWAAVRAELGACERYAQTRSEQRRAG